MGLRFPEIRRVSSSNQLLITAFGTGYILRFTAVYFYFNCYIRHFRRISSIKEELIPHLVKKQFSISSKNIGKPISNEVEDVPHPRLQPHNGESSRKSKKFTALSD